MISSIRPNATDASHTLTVSTNNSTTIGVSSDNRKSNENTSTNNVNIIDHKIQSTRQWINDIVIGEKLCPFAIPLWKKKDSTIRIVSSNATSTKDAIRDVQNEIIDLVGKERVEDDTKNSNKHETTLIVFDCDYNTLLSQSQHTDTEQQQHSQQHNIYQQYNSNFSKNYIDFVRLSWMIQEQVVGETYQELIHIVLFHPLATHQTYGNDQNNNPADYTIRSPYPTIHLLRQQDILNVVESNKNYADYEYIPSRNKAKFIQQGIQVCQERLQQCTRTTKDDTR
jgi:uncharacterized protein